MAPAASTVNELAIGSNGFLTYLDRVEAGSRWRERYAQMPYGQGLGVAGSTYISGTNYCIYPNDMPQAAVQITLDRSGRARVFSGANDIGQGSNTMLAVIVSEELGLVGLPIGAGHVLSGLAKKGLDGAHQQWGREGQETESAESVWDRHRSGGIG